MHYMVQNLAIGSYLSKNQEQAFNNFEFEIKHKKKQKQYNFVYPFHFN